MKKQFLLNRIFDTLYKPAKYEKEIKSVYIDKKNFVMVTFTDDDKAKFYTKYADKLLKGNHIQFSARKRGFWLNPVKELELKVLKEAPTEILDGTLNINYASRFKTDERGEYVYLPRSTFKPRTGKSINGNSILYLDTIPQNDDQGILMGYGLLEGKFSRRGKTILVENISSFNPEIRENIVEIDLADIEFHLTSISVRTETGVFDCSAENVSFEFDPTFNQYKQYLKGGKVTISSTQRKIGKVKKVNDSWEETTHWVQHGDAKWDFSNIEAISIMQLVKDQKIDEKYQNLLKELKELKNFVSFSTLKAKFKKTGKQVTNKELSALFFHTGYDEDIFHYLEGKATEIFVDNLSFVFKIPDNNSESKFVWEVPKRTLATYIFSDKLESKQLFARLKETQRMDIRNNKEIQDALGFDGFIIHTTAEAWIDKFTNIIN